MYSIKIIDLTLIFTKLGKPGSEVVIVDCGQIKKDIGTKNE